MTETYTPTLFDIEEEEVEVDYDNGRDGADCGEQ